MDEIWKDIEGYEGCYRISSIGRVKSLERTVRCHKNANGIDTVKTLEKMFLKPMIRRGGYFFVQLSKNGVKTSFSIHRLVISAFTPNVDNKPQINHINGIKTDNRIENLEWCTSLENQMHAIRTGLKIPSGKGRYGYDSLAGKEIFQYDKDFIFIAQYGSLSEANRTTGVNIGNMAQCAKLNKKYSHAGGFIWRYEQI